MRRKVLVLDLDETLIHSHHDGVLRQTVKPGTPPDFVLKVTIDRHPVRFFVHKRPHVDFFLEVVMKTEKTMLNWAQSAIMRLSLYVQGVQMVRAGRIHCQYGDLRHCGGRQAGRWKGYLTTKVYRRATYNF